LRIKLSPPLLPLAVLLSLPLIIQAQDERRLINAAQIPASGGAPQDFVPQGWKIEEEIKGDLNNDARPDVVLKLVEDLPAKDKDDIATERSRALVVLLRKADGGLQRAGVADRLLLCTRCGGAFYGGEETPAEVSVKNGVIVVEQGFGSREVTDLTYRFRYEPAARRFRLIGLDVVSRDRATGETTDESTNFLTGLKITKKTRYDEKRDREVPVANSRRRVAVRRVFLEEADYERLSVR
jgi:hypothetical protein